ncbi:MAG: hypothetical protein V1767_01070 [Chloroflexota bacterium]
MRKNKNAIIKDVVTLGEKEARIKWNNIPASTWFLYVKKEWKAEIADRGIAPAPAPAHPRIKAVKPDCIDEKLPGPIKQMIESKPASLSLEEFKNLLIKGAHAFIEAIKEE